MIINGKIISCTMLLTLDLCVSFPRLSSLLNLPAHFAYGLISRQHLICIKTKTRRLTPANLLITIWCLGWMGHIATCKNHNVLVHDIKRIHKVSKRVLQHYFTGRLEWWRMKWFAFSNSCCIGFARMSRIKQQR